MLEVYRTEIVSKSICGEAEEIRLETNLGRFFGWRSVHGGPNFFYCNEESNVKARHNALEWGQEVSKLMYLYEASKESLGEALNTCKPVIINFEEKVAEIKACKWCGHYPCGCGG